MQEIQPELIEKYQLILQKDPKSQVFAPLTEAYRKMGLIEEAFRIAVRGVQFNPTFSGGRIALARVFLDRDNVPGAIEELERAIEISADNILANSLLGECYLKAKRPKDALRAFKMVLFLAPNNEKAQKAVKKLEALTADEYDAEIFEMKPLPSLDELKTADTLKPMETRPIGDLERILSLADAYIVRNDSERALAALREGEQGFGAHPEITKRLRLINQKNLEGAEDAPSPEAPPPTRAQTQRDGKIALLKQLLERIQKNSQFT